MTLQTLLNKKVITADGKCLGKIYDFKAATEGSDIIITHIRVGMVAWLVRLGIPGWLKRRDLEQHGFDLPFEAIASVDSAVRLKEGWDWTRCTTCHIHVDALS